MQDGEVGRLHWYHEVPDLYGQAQDQREWSRNPVLGLGPPEDGQALPPEAASAVLQEGQLDIRRSKEKGER